MNLNATLKRLYIHNSIVKEERDTVFELLLRDGMITVHDLTVNGIPTPNKILSLHDAGLIDLNLLAGMYKLFKRNDNPDDNVVIEYIGHILLKSRKLSIVDINNVNLCRRVSIKLKTDVLFKTIIVWISYHTLTNEYIDYIISTNPKYLEEIVEFIVTAFRDYDFHSVHTLNKYIECIIHLSEYIVVQPEYITDILYNLFMLKREYSAIDNLYASDGINWLIENGAEVLETFNSTSTEKIIISLLDITESAFNQIEDAQADEDTVLLYELLPSIKNKILAKKQLSEKVRQLTSLYASLIRVNTKITSMINQRETRVLIGEVASKRYCFNNDQIEIDIDRVTTEIIVLERTVPLSYL
jgi:hypothetical protein